MSKLNPIEQSEYIENEYRKYLKSSFHFENNDYQTMFDEELNKADLYKGPYLNLTLPFKTGHTLNELIDLKLINKNFTKLSNINLDQKLYLHQNESIEKIDKGRNVVITTGTGSGKTECFLYPIINKIMNEIDNGNDGSGARAIFLYPLNALVNDQMDRVREILRDYPEITFGYFTGDNKIEDADESTRIQLSKERGYEIPENELIARNEIRENPPHLLFTNYSMLEYLLIRPNDYSIISEEALKNWNFVVLDEAHTYNGALGIEVSMLLKRLCATANKHPQYILTSATLGEKGKSEKEIIEFATSLTSASYEEDDIIFAKREKYKQSLIDHESDPSIYEEVEELINNKENIFDVLKISKSDNDFHEILYEYLISDSNTYVLYKLLEKESKTFKYIYQNMKEYGFKDRKQLISFIHLINLARKDHKMIYDIKYHTFIRSLHGAYASIGKNKKLRLTACNEIDGMKAFELGNCRICNTPYIIGAIKNNYLYQNDEIDIYENYGDNENVYLDYFVFKEYVNEETFDKDIVSEYIICSKCGRVYEKGNLNADKCDCDTNYSVEVYKINYSNENKNNIRVCPCCGRTRNSGIVRTINLGKDEGTAILGQNLFQSIEDNSNKEIIASKPVFGKKRIEKYKGKDIKQFLAFSDSRQQASFFATFYNANHERFLNKRIIWKMIEDNQYNDISVPVLSTSLESLIDTEDLFDDELGGSKHAWISILSELLNVDGVNSAEGLGIFHFELNCEKYFSNAVTQENLDYVFGENKINLEEFYTLIKVIFNIFRVSSAINYTSAGLSQEERKEYLSYRRFENYIQLSAENKTSDNIYKKNIRSFIPKAGITIVLAYVMRAINCDKEKAKEILEQIFDFSEEVKLITQYQGEKIYQINADKYILKNYKKTQYYRCKKCGRITPYNVKNICTGNKCEGELEPIDPDVILSNNYYRYQYMNKTIEKIVIKEHTAQLSRKISKDYQKRFKNKDINILSCSTTFEMGIDIGSLENVFLRNVPPTPANYVQRAGRAGRGEDSSSFILTYCGTSSHDYTYFDDPQKMIAGVIRPPYFDVGNEKILIRHLFASAFGYFFRKHPNYCRSIKELVFNDGIKEFKKYIESKPEDLNEYINNRILTNNKFNYLKDFKWYENNKLSDNVLERFEKKYEDEKDSIIEAINHATKNEDYSMAKHLKGLQKELNGLRVIDSLSQNNIIPRYGFPVDTINLEVYENGVKNQSYDLNRDLLIGISEYAPGSEVISDKKKFTSKYITLPKTKQMRKYYYCECEVCQKINIGYTWDEAKECDNCGNINNNTEIKFFIKPKYGFKTGETKESTRLKPKKSYSGEIEYIGKGIIDLEKIKISDIFSIETYKDDELMITNSSVFYMCPECGYTELVKENTGLPTINMKHKSFNGYNCKNTQLDKIRIGHTFKTDVAHISIKALNKKDMALSFLYALLEGISIEFDIERNDINGLVHYNALSASYDILVYDNVPGGAGHVKRLMDVNMLISSIEAAKNKVSKSCCDEDTSCYNCLRNYYNQKVHKRLKRRYAIDVCKLLLKSITSI